MDHVRLHVTERERLHRERPERVAQIAEPHRRQAGHHALAGFAQIGDGIAVYLRTVA